MKSIEFTKKVPLELLCMLLLEERDMYGYEMVQELKKRTDGTSCSTDRQLQAGVAPIKRPSRIMAGKWKTDS